MISCNTSRCRGFWQGETVRTGYGRCHIQNAPLKIKWGVGNTCTNNSAGVSCTFSHPDYTVGSGVPPDQPDQLAIGNYQLTINTGRGLGLRGPHRRSGIGQCKLISRCKSIALTLPRRLFIKLCGPDYTKVVAEVNEDERGVNAPQFNDLFGDLRLPTFSNTYQRIRWVDGQPVDTDSPWETTVLGLATLPGETIHTPDSGYNIGGGYDVLVLYAEETRLTLKYTREDDMVFGYTVYLEDVCVHPSLLALYQTLNDNGRTTLPALPGGQPVGRAIGGEIKIAIRDSGHFLDPRSCNDWWQDFPGSC